MLPVLSGEEDNPLQDKELLVSKGQYFPKDMKEMVFHVSKDLAALGLPEEMANYFSFRMIDCIRINMGGNTIYLSKGISLQRAIRNSEIYKKFDGKNYQELCKELGVTPRWIQTVVARARKKKLSD